jgi:hypothetical protein
MLTVGLSVLPAGEPRWLAALDQSATAAARPM